MPGGIDASPQCLDEIVPRPTTDLSTGGQVVCNDQVTIQISHGSTIEIGSVATHATLSQILPISYTNLLRWRLWSRSIMRDDHRLGRWRLPKSLASSGKAGRFCAEASGCPQEASASDRQSDLRGHYRSSGTRRADGMPIRPRRSWPIPCRIARTQSSALLSAPTPPTPAVRFGAGTTASKGSSMR